MWYVWSLAVGVIQAPLYSVSLPIFVLLAAALTLLVIPNFWSRLCGSLLLGLACGSWHLQYWCDAQLASRFEQQVFDVTFQVISIPRQNAQSTVFLAKVLELHCEVDCPDLQPGRLRLSWYRNQQPLSAGQIWRSQIKLRRPRGFVNPGGFDYHAWLLAQRVLATGYLTDKPQFLGEEYVWAATRSGIESALFDQSYTSTYRRFWSALLIGEQNSISQKDWQTLQATGTVHLLVISGLHIGLVAGWCFFIAGVVARIFGVMRSGSNMTLMHYLPPLCACLGAGGYAAFAGFSIPTLRALVACVALMLCRILGLNLSPATLLGLGVLAIGLSEPFAWESAGFWLSFLAVAVLFFTLSGRRRQSLGDSLVRSQIVLSIGLILPLLTLGQGTSLLSPVANLVAVPLVSLVLVPMLLVAALCSGVVPDFTVLLLRLMDWIFGGLWWFFEYLQHLPIPLWWPAVPLEGWSLLVAGIAVALTLAPTGLTIRTVGAVWLVLVLFARPDADFQLRLTVLDVGQGTAVVVQTPQHTWLYDAGPQFSEDFDAGSRIVAPYLRSLGTRHFNMIISHADMDHAGGAVGVADALDVQKLLHGEPVPDLKIVGEPCRAGQRWRSDDVEWSVLWPLARDLSGNNSSCVVLLTLHQSHGTVRILLPGDIDRHVEAQLLAELDSPVDWVLAPHHGSKTSSGLGFVQWVQAQHVVFSAGFNNRYGHPHPRVVERWQNSGAALYNTATDGAVIFTWQDSGLTVERMRDAQRRLWH